MRDVEVRGVAFCAARDSDLFQASNMVLERFVAEPAATQTSAVGRSTEAPLSFTTRNGYRTLPGAKSTPPDKGYFGAISRRKRLKRAGVSLLLEEVLSGEEWDAAQPLASRSAANTTNWRTCED